MPFPPCELCSCFVNEFGNFDCAVPAKVYRVERFCL